MYVISMSFRCALDRTDRPLSLISKNMALASHLLSNIRGILIFSCLSSFSHNSHHVQSNSLMLFRLLCELPAVWFSWDEFLTAAEIPIKNNTIVTVDEKQSSHTYRKNKNRNKLHCNVSYFPLEGARHYEMSASEGQSSSPSRVDWWQTWYYRSRD